MTGALRTLALGLFAVGLVLALVGTGGFSSAAADRDVTVATAADDRAYVGYDSPDEIVIEADGNTANETDLNATNETDLNTTNETDLNATNESDLNATNETDVDRSETVTLVTLTNRFSVAVDVTEVDIEGKPDGLTVDVRPPPSDVSPGESGSESVVAALECEGTFEDEPLSVTIRVRGEDVEAVVFGDTARRTVSVTCEAGP